MEVILGISKEEIISFIEKVLVAIKGMFAKLGILILPEDDELPAQK